jgi:hypothetical protein
MKRSHPSEQGSVLMYVLITLTILLALSAATLRPVSDQYVNTFRTAAWQEALLAAEAGVDVATLQLRTVLQNSGQAWPRWLPTQTATAHIQPPPANAPETAWPSPWSFGGGKLRASQSFTHTGEGGSSQKVDVVIDAPVSLYDTVNDTQYYRIRSTGTVYVEGTKRAGGEKRDLALRKFSMRFRRLTGDPERDAAAGSTPIPVPRTEVTRTVEVIVKPATAFPVALLSRDSTTMTNHNVEVDSYDSDDTTKSTNGQYDAAKRQQHGDVATDGLLIAAGDAHIYGNVSTNGGSVTGVSNVSGVIRDDFYQDLPDPPSPSWTIFTPATVSGTTTLTGSPVKGAARFKIPSISLTGNNTLTLTGLAGSTTVNYIELWVTGSVSVGGNGSIQLAKNLIASIYVAGDTDIGGNGIGNAGGASYERPANFLLYGLKPNSTQSVKLNGNADVEAAVYAPYADVTIVGGGSSGEFAGSVVGKSIFMNGVTSVHYDEALSRRSIVTGYRIGSWVEDIR